MAISNSELSQAKRHGQRTMGNIFQILEEEILERDRVKLTQRMRWRAKRERGLAERIEPERMDSVCTQRDIREEAEKNPLKTAKKEWKSRAKPPMEEKI